jgi:hypothetical protein
LLDVVIKLGEVTGVILAASVSPSQALTETILKIDLYRNALVLDEFDNVIASQSGHRLPGLSSE